MGLEPFSQKQKFALSLAAPVLAAEPGSDYQCLSFAPKDKVTEILAKRWNIISREQLIKKLDWLDSDGGYTIEYLRLHHYLAEMLYVERQDFVASLAARDNGQYVRAKLVEQYLNDLGEHTIRAFDIASQSVLVRAGYVMGWFEEGETWQRLTLQADIVVDHGMFKTHFDYLFSYVVGRAFGLKLGNVDVMRVSANMRSLVAGADSPYVSFAPWPSGGFGDSTVEKETR